MGARATYYYTLISRESRACKNCNGAAAAGRTVLLVGDAQLGGCATVAALHLARASGVSPSATLLSLRNACPAALHHQVDLDALAALAF